MRRLTCRTVSSPASGRKGLAGMSRTDVHRPFEVQATDPYNRHRVRVTLMYSDGSGGPSYWPLYNTCGCQMCSGQFERRYNNGRARCAWRAARQDLLKTTVEDRDDMDVAPLRGSRWWF